MEIKIHSNYLLFELLKKNVKSEALKQIVKELEQAIFGYDDDKDEKELEET